MPYVAPAGPENAAAVPVSGRALAPAFCHEGARVTVSPGSRIASLPGGVLAESSTTSACGRAAAGSHRQIAEQPSPSAVLPSSQDSSPSTTPLPQVDGGSVPAVPALFIGAGVAKMKSLALSLVSSQLSRTVGMPQMSMRRCIACPATRPTGALNGVPTPDRK